MKEGKLVNSDIIVRLIQKAMLESENDKFLIDGFPRNEENRIAFEKIVCIFFNPFLAITVFCAITCCQGYLGIISTLKYGKLKLYISKFVGQY